MPPCRPRGGGRVLITPRSVATNAWAVVPPNGTNLRYYDTIAFFIHKTYVSVYNNFYLFLISYTPFKIIGLVSSCVLLDGLCFNSTIHVKEHIRVVFS
jgi:hypothetical protein